MTFVEIAARDADRAARADVGRYGRRVKLNGAFRGRARRQRERTQARRKV